MTSPDRAVAARQIKERDGIPLTEQLWRALLAWVESRGATITADRKRAVPRQRQR